MPKPRGQKEADFLLRYKKLEIIADAVHLIFPWGSLVAIFGFLYLIASKLAGQVTLAQLGMNIAGSLHVPDVVAYLFGGSGMAYGLRERQLRHKKIAEITSHSHHLETLVDQNRTSSGLTPYGTTRPEDKI